MARIVSKSRAGENGAKPTGYCRFYRKRIIAPFGCEGKPDHAWKSRTFNNLGCTFLTGLPAISFLPMPTGPLRPSSGGPDAIVVLVERGGAMIATRRDHGIFALH